MIYTVCKDNIFCRNCTPIPLELPAKYVITIKRLSEKGSSFENYFDISCITVIFALCLCMVVSGCGAVG